MFLNRSSVKHAETTGFTGVFLYLNPYRILCNENIIILDCVLLDPASFPNASSPRGLTCSPSAGRIAREPLCQSGFPCDLTELYVPLLGFTPRCRVHWWRQRRNGEASEPNRLSLAWSDRHPTSSWPSRLPPTFQAGDSNLPGLFAVAHHSGLRSGLASVRARRTPSAS